ncbi:Two-component response regulator SSK1p [Didymella pomorum]
MSSIKSSRRFLPKFLRRSSATSTTTRSTASAGSDAGPPRAPSTLRKSISLSKLAEHGASEVHDVPVPEIEPRLVQSEVLQKPHVRGEHSHSQHSQNTATTASASSRSPAFTRASTSTSADPSERKLPISACPQLTLEEPTPIHPPVAAAAAAAAAAAVAEAAPTPSPASSADPDPATSDLTSVSNHPTLPRRQSLVAHTDARVIRTLLAPDAPAEPSAPSAPPADYFGGVQPAISAGMLHRKIWVKRPNASATLVQIGEDDLVDDVRDMILRKYANSLGRSFDSPDVTLRIVPRDAGQGQERTLGPEEDMCRTLDAYFPGGQTVHEALIIDVPVRRTPKPSPRVPLYYAHHDDAQHAQTEYFPPMPVIQPSPAAIQHGPPHAPHSIAVLTNGGQIAPLPSPGGAAQRRVHHSARPRMGRTHTASPTTMAGGIPSSNTNIRPNRPRHDSSASADKHSQASNALIPTPPAVVEPPVRTQHDTPPTVRVASPRPEKEKKKRRKPAPAEPPSLPAGLLDGSVPPINVLIVEDNIINLRVLGAFMQRLKVRWQRAMNGKEAVTKWKAGGFHLVLMDIQLPVMNGLEATKEIRRLERVNSIGVFSSGSSEAPNTRLGQQNGSDTELVEDDKLGDRSLFKSPVIIVALTASSLQSDRHEALAAGCNDFLTKPVNFVWLERKVKEWGCMQALIDFDGWRKWKDFAKDSDSAKDKDTNKMSTSMASIAPARKSTSAKPTAPQLAANTSETNGSSSVSQEVADKKAKRKSLVQAPPSVPEDESETPTPDAESA